MSISKLNYGGRNIYENTAIAKINELVDIVNALIKENNIHEMQIDELQMKIEPDKIKDPYEEQRKWVGKLCFFWNDNKEDTCYGVLGDIIEDVNEPFPFEAKDYALWYSHCEPVKPDNDIIFKGE